MPREPRPDRTRARPGAGDLGRLAAVPLLAMLDRELLADGLERCWLVPCAKGLPVIEEGEYDDRFFVVVEGSCEVSLASGAGDRQSISGWLGAAGEPRVSLFPGRTVVADLHEGDFFGELACMSPWPRASTVTPSEDALLLEVDEDVFEQWRDGSDAFRRVMDEAYMARGLATAIRRVDALACLTGDDVALLSGAATIVIHERGAIVVREGEAADAFYLVRGGSAAVSKRVDGEDRTVSYLRAGSYFGEAALLRGTPRTATVTAATPLELIRIGGDALVAVLARSPGVSRALEDAAHRRSAAAAKIVTNDDLAGALSFLVREGLFASSDALVVELGRCTRCGLCETACERSHGTSRIALHGPTRQGHLFPTACRQCTDPLCLLRCPVDAIHRETDGEVRLEDHCIGCGRCQVNCPWGTITMLPTPARPVEGLKRPVTRKAVKCDQCAGIGGAPRCVASCATAAIRLLSPRQLLSPLLAKAS